MLENLGLAIATLCTMYGAALLYDAASAYDESSAFRLFGGAVALAGGIITIVLITRSKLHWRRIQKQNRQGV